MKKEPIETRKKEKTRNKVQNKGKRKRHESGRTKKEQVTEKAQSKVLNFRLQLICLAG